MHCEFKMAALLLNKLIGLTSMKLGLGIQCLQFKMADVMRSGIFNITCFFTIFSKTNAWNGWKYRAELLSVFVLHAG